MVVIGMVLTVRVINMLSAKFNFLKSEKILSKTILSKLDTVQNAQPFVSVVTKEQSTQNIDIVKDSQPFIGAK